MSRKPQMEIMEKPHWELYDSTVWGLMYKNYDEKLKLTGLEKTVTNKTFCMFIGSVSYL